MRGIRKNIVFAISIMAAVVMLLYGAARLGRWQGERSRAEYERARLLAPRDIHNDARKCRNHCHNAGLVVGSWDGAYPARHTEHGCRCTEGGAR